MKSNITFGFVYLHSHTIDYSTEFWSDLKEFQLGDVLFFCGDTCTVDGYNVACQLQATGYPYVALLGIMDGKPQVVYSNVGQIQISSLISKLEHEIQIHEPHMQYQKQSKMEIQMDRQIRASQDDAYKKSLQIDKEKKRKKDILNQKKQQIINQFKQRFILREQKLEWKEGIAFKIRLPNGQGVVTKIPIDTCIDQIYEYINYFDPADEQNMDYDQESLFLINVEENEETKVFKKWGFLILYSEQKLLTLEKTISELKMKSSVLNILINL